MKEIRTVLLFSIFLFSFLLAKGKTKNIIFITFDGLRWEEVFYGADSLLIHSEKYTKDQSQILKDYWNSSYRIRREKLMPFFWNTIINQGQLYGNVRNGSIATLENPYLFSYPGYSEMLVGYVDLTRNSNNKENNPNITVLEYIHNQPGYNNKVAAFCSWDVFDFIIYEKRSGIYVSAGMESYGKGRNNPKIGLLNEIMLQIPVPWKSVRYDAITHNFAKTYLEEITIPRSIVILRQFLKCHGYTLFSKEKFIKRKKHTIYKIVTIDKEVSTPQKKEKVVGSFD